MGYGNKTVHATGRPSIPGNSELPLTTPLKALIQISRKFIYLNLDANECLERIKQRRRSEEDNVSLDLLQNIQNSHEEMMKIINTIHIDANKHQAEIVENILEKIYICD